MRYKKSLIFLCLFICLFSIAGISASEITNETLDMVKMENGNSSFDVEDSLLDYLWPKYGFDPLLLDHIQGILIVPLAFRILQLYINVHLDIYTIEYLMFLID